ncbi:hypothetical protein HQ487_04035 [Candidatus Uhrbacteria bacterium]|nr:hypothetical protein [Candidatus Uhrbacteria bacterium]
MKTASSASRTDADQVGRYVLPSSIMDAVMEFTILVEVDRDNHDTFEFTCAASVGDIPLLITTEDFFRQAGFTPRLGEYAFQLDYSDNLYLTNVPDGTTDDQRLALIGNLPELIKFRDYFDSWIRALLEFPRPSTILNVAYTIACVTLEASCRNLIVPGAVLVDPRTIRAEGVSCIKCDFPNTMMIEGVHYAINDDDDGCPLVLIGYLTHNSPFAVLLNGELAERMHDAFVFVADRVALNQMVAIKLALQSAERAIEQMEGSFVIDMDAVDVTVHQVEQGVMIEIAAAYPNRFTFEEGVDVMDTTDDPIHNPPSTSDGADNSATSPAG